MRFNFLSRVIPLLVLLTVQQTSSRAQQASNGAINVAGSTYTDDKLVIEWSVGELLRIDTRILNDRGVVVTQGLLQPDYARPLVMVSDRTFAAGEIKLFPNPVKTRLQVQFSMRESGHLRYFLHDQNGSRLQQNAFHYYGYGNTQYVDMTGYAQGAYFLYVEIEPSSGEKMKKGLFKIIKID